MEKARNIFVVLVGKFEGKSYLEDLGIDGRKKLCCIRY
jgi:hypothetical protein